MPVPLVERGIPAKEIIIFFSVHIPHINPFSFAEHYRKGMIIMRPVFILQVQEAGRCFGTG
jgi:hypothetical protein